MEKKTRSLICSNLSRDSPCRKESTSCCQCRQLQWTTTPSYTVSETTVWRPPHVNYTRNNTACLCLRCRNMEYSRVRTLATYLSLDEKTEQTKREEERLTKSKNLKFGIERILTQCSNKEANVAGM